MRVGILGGSFNPIHNGHIRMAIEALEQMQLDRVELVPAKQPPHKEGGGLLPFDLRVALIEKAIEGVVGLRVNPLEGERTGPSFTCDTLQCYRQRQPEDKFYFILGASTFMELPTWKSGLKIPHMTNLIVVNRWEAAKKLSLMIEHHWPNVAQTEDAVWHFSSEHELYALTLPRLDIKASDIRRRWGEKRSLHSLVPNGVETMLASEAKILASCWG